MNMGEGRFTVAAQQFARDGVVVLRGVLDTAWLQHLSAALDQALAAPTPLAQNLAGTQGGAFHSDLYLSSAFASFREFAMRSPVGEIGARMLGVEHVTLFTDELLVKEPGTPQETPWHHDMPYWPLGGDSVCSVWIPLDRVIRHVGALEFLRGSHLWGRRFHPRNFDSGLDRQTEAREESLQSFIASDPDQVITTEADPGDCIVFHALTLHRAFGNTLLDARRRAVVLRLVGPSVVYEPRPRTIPLIWAPALAPGSPLGTDGELFPRLWPLDRDPPTGQAPVGIR
jgi:ectoine hydroxylase-related dioxygenase (phytanoyl-CoA dioxygenase family)